ncbi:MAG TPA: DUF1801 domain-containing protein [Anaerolineales bacterium]|nr:DUF1801 domain-containing protein [Anaerolineales bacterium]
MKKAAQPQGSKPLQQVTRYIASLSDWRGPMVARLRAIILQAEPGLTEEWKWGTPVWSHNGLVCAVSAFKGYVKVNFFKGASLKDPKGLFNAGLDAKTMRSIDFRQGDKIDAAALKALVRAAVAVNTGARKKV